MLKYLTTALSILNISIISMFTIPTLACSSLPFIFEARDKPQFTIETNLFAPIVVLDPQMVPEILSVKDSTQQDLSEYLRVESYPSLKTALETRKIKPLKKWQPLLQQKATFMTLVTRNFKPLEFYEKTPVSISLKTSQSNKPLRVVLNLNKNSVETAGTCKFSPRFIDN
jgi:hypothetical protein